MDMGSPCPAAGADSFWPEIVVMLESGASILDEEATGGRGRNQETRQGNAGEKEDGIVSQQLLRLDSRINSPSCPTPDDTSDRWCRDAGAGVSGGVFL